MHNIMKSFKDTLAGATNILILTGSGVSAESGVPTFRGAGGFWRTYQATYLATPQAFKANPSLVWEFYEYRRDLATKVQPNKAHEAIAHFEKKCMSDNKKVTVVTQNIDGLHQRAGSKNVIELHGSLFKTRCTRCDNVEVNHNIPICPALQGKCSPNPDDMSSDIPVEDLPKCQKNSCFGLLRPHIVWFGENLDSDILAKTEEIVESCDICLIAGTSSIVYPAAMFAPRVAERGKPVAEFNLEETPATESFQYHFQGPCSVTLAEALSF
ncbi:NAD-dependent protein deacylase-like [Chelonus insularis]|uniref:NAD-dependent protein deacylase-like n=1 Tax=Chelonus insularis TaxID=460826 RepID=UPI00158BF8A5|nr:NAD-dependent protein deacylase-like [Chelonus insularis]XP_034940855.1 NAD-dependent protein deacylase-like [Chelonus insularis]